MAYLPTNLCKTYLMRSMMSAFSSFYSLFTLPFKLTALKIYFTKFFTISTLDYVALVSIRINLCQFSELYIRNTMNLKTYPTAISV